MTIISELLIGLLYASTLALPGINRLIPLRLNANAPNPASSADRIDPIVDMGLLERTISPFAPQKPAATMEDMADAIEATNDELHHTLDKFERLLNQKRAQVSALRTRLDQEEADLAERTEQLARMRAALRVEPETVETAEKTQ